MYIEIVWFIIMQWVGDIWDNVFINGPSKIF